ncbi:hypothetical protein N9F70_00255 [bacterium]|nr:hypothetical protein [bacterium]
MMARRLAMACFLVVLPGFWSLGVAGEPAGEISEAISGKEIFALQKGLIEAGGASSSTRKRRAYKNVVRDGEDLLEKSPEAASRFRVLEIIFQSQKRLLVLENSDRNREALFATSRKLVEAPDELADLRLEADMLLAERDLSERNADVKARTQALAELIARYRHTPGEKKSLMMASLIAPKLEAFELEKQIIRAMNERFAGDYDLIEWRRKNNGNSNESVLFTGFFKRVDGSSLTFPIDGIGHTCVLVFWSKDTPEIAARLAKVKDLQTRFPGHIDVFSFNVDVLADGGEKTLRSLGLDWTAMLLPEGKKSQTYRVVARQDPMVVRVNAHGHAFLPSTLIDELLKEVSMEQNLDDPRYLAQLQSLLVGEFLLPRDIPAPAAGSVPENVRKAIQDCFIDAPLRYRLTRSQALANYHKAEKLSRDAIAQHPKASDLWHVRNCRIIALFGMWKLAFEPQHLADAVAESRIALAATIPDRAKVVPRFCLAIEALRRGESTPLLVLTELVNDGALPSAYAAAAVLAMNFNAIDLHAKFREILLEFPNDDPALWPVVSFLKDQNHRFRLFKYNYYMPASLARRIVRADLRSNAADLDAPADTSGPVQVELTTLAGEKLSLPEATDGKLTLLMFVEPPADGDAEFPTLINGAVTEDSRGRKVETLGVMQQAFGFAGQHVHKEIKVIAAFLSDDTDRIKALMQQNAWPCQVVMVPGGLNNPLVRRLGVLSADRVPNIVLLRPDGTIIWKLSGSVHPQVRSEGLGETLGVISRALKTQIDRYEIERSIVALEQGDHDEAARLFSGPFPPPERPNPDGWTAPRLHGRALANIQLERWEAALSDLDAAIMAHESVFNRKKPCGCHRVAGLLVTKAKVLDQLGRSQEAGDVRKRAGAAKFTHPDTRYGSLHDRIEETKANEKK